MSTFVEIFLHMKRISTLITFILIASTTYAQQILEVPGLSEFAKIDTSGYSVLPSGRYVTPAGKTIRITDDPFGLSISPNKKWAITIHNAAFTRIDLANNTAKRFPEFGTPDKNSPYGNSSFLGIVFTSDSQSFYLSGGDAGNVHQVDIATGHVIRTISLNGSIGGNMFQDSFASDMVINPSKNELLVLDQANFRMVRIDLSTGALKSSTATGRLPFGITLSPDHQFAFVANVGMYAYPIIPGTTPENIQSQYIPHHPYGNDTQESREGTTLNGKKIPGLGDPRSDEAMSLFQIDLQTNKTVKVYKPGFQMGEMVEEMEVVGGSSPNSIAVGSKYVYVSNATNDNIAVIDYKTRKIKSHIPIQFSTLLDKRRGYLPFGLTLSKNETTLYVTLLGLNAVAVIDVRSNKTLGFIPTGWGPTRVKLSDDEKTLYVTSCRGYGAGPNGGAGYKAPKQGTYIGDVQLGTFQAIPMPSDAELAAFSAVVKNNTFVVKDGSKRGNKTFSITHPGQSPIKHIVYITKENRTYDEFFGQFKGANGDSSIARFGLNRTIYEKNKTIQNVDVTPNHHQIAQAFSMSDNFYCDSDASIHGHHWMMGVIPNEWVETNSSVSKSANYFAEAPGRRFPGSTGSMDPEDYAEIGGIWEALERKNVSFYNFGEANETGHVRESWADTLTGAGHIVMVPMQKALFKNTSHNYAGFNTSIPDQFRVQQFETEFTEKWLSGKGKCLLW
jgi:YVTN family beta-propeller protein